VFRAGRPVRPGNRVQDFRRPLRVEPDGIHINDRRPSDPKPAKTSAVAYSGRSAPTLRCLVWAPQPPCGRARRRSDVAPSDSCEQMFPWSTWAMQAPSRNP